MNQGICKLSEKEFQRQVIQYARLLGYKVAHFRPARQKGKEGAEDRWVTPVEADGAGFPDLILVSSERGRTIAAELKSETGTTSAAQRDWLDHFAATATETYLWRPRDWEEIVRLLSTSPPGSPSPTSWLSLVA